MKQEHLMVLLAVGVFLLAQFTTQKAMAIDSSGFPGAAELMLLYRWFLHFLVNSLCTCTRQDLAHRLNGQSDLANMCGKQFLKGKRYMIGRRL